MQGTGTPLVRVGKEGTHHPPAPPALLHVPGPPAVPAAGRAREATCCDAPSPGKHFHLRAATSHHISEVLPPTPHVALTAAQHPVSPHITRAALSPATSSRKGELGQTAECRAARGAAHSAAAVLQPLPAVLSAHPSSFCPPDHRRPPQPRAALHSPVELPPSRRPPLRSHRVPPEPFPLTWRQRSPAGALSRTLLPSGAISPSRSAAWRQPRQTQLALTAPTSYCGESALGSGGNEPPPRGSASRARPCEGTGRGGRIWGTSSPDAAEKRALRPWRCSAPALSASPLPAGAAGAQRRCRRGSRITLHWDSAGTLMAPHHCAASRPRAQGGASATNRERGAE